MKNNGMTPVAVASASVSQRIAKPTRRRSRAVVVLRTAAAFVIWLSSARRRAAGLSALGVVRLQYRRPEFCDESLQLIFTEKSPIPRFIDGEVNDVDTCSDRDVFDRTRNTDDRDAMFPAPIILGNVRKVQAHPRRWGALYPRFLWERNVNDGGVQLGEVIEFKRRVVRYRCVLERSVCLGPEDRFVILLETGRRPIRKPVKTLSKTL
jgi:hypothetical protein